MTINLRSLDPDLLTDFALEWERCGWVVIPSNFESPKEMGAFTRRRKYSEYFPMSHGYVTNGEHKEELRNYWNEWEQNLYPEEYSPVRPTHLLYHVTVQASPDIKVSELKFPKPTWRLITGARHGQIRYNISNYKESGFVCSI